MTGDHRLAAAEALLREEGWHGAVVRAEGPDREIAAISLPAGEWRRALERDVSPVAAGIRALGFRHVALDLQVGDP